MVIVAARSAWPEYNEFHAYVCQPNRSFQQVARLGFYSKGVIYPLVPKILEVHDDVEMVQGKHSGKLGELVDHLVTSSLRLTDQRYKVILLSPPDLSSTLKLDAEIPNDKRSKSGKPTAFTMGVIWRLTSPGSLPLTARGCYRCCDPHLAIVNNDDLLAFAFLVAKWAKTRR